MPNGYDVSEIDISSIRLNETIPAEPCPINVGDYDNDGVEDLMVKFDMQAVKSILIVGTQTIIITGTVSGIQFQGTDTIKVISPYFPFFYKPIVLLSKQLIATI